MNKSEQIARLRLIRTRNIGPMTYSLLMLRYGSAEAAIAAIPTLAQRGGSKISLASIASVTAELESIDAADAVLLWRDSEYYPERLPHFDDAPACITARGNLHLLTQPMIAIVGARNASINAQRHAHNIASELGKHDYIIVSGMARSIAGRWTPAPLAIPPAVSILSTSRKTRICLKKSHHADCCLQKCRQRQSQRPNIFPSATG